MALCGCAVGILASFLSLDQNSSRLNLHFVEFLYGRIFDVMNGTLIKQLCISSIQVHSLRWNAWTNWINHFFDLVQTRDVFLRRNGYFLRASWNHFMNSAFPRASDKRSRLSSRKVVYGIISWTTFMWSLCKCKRKHNS